MDINKEKLKIIKQKGNVLVTANPGTGKTLLLAYKYIDLLNDGLKPEDILCLTFTNKAKCEMENRITGLITEEKLNVDVSKLNIFTFHSYALNYLDDSSVISSNMLRYVIYKHLKEHETLNYEDTYLVENIIPKFESLMRYLKNFGITPDKINIKEAKKFIEQDTKFEKEDLERFLQEFVTIFAEYEKFKSTKGCDYTDLLLEFLKLSNPPHFKFVLVDELQDVNAVEADIAIKSADNFLAVGDAKQAIFGFQGGSILNFSKFGNSTKFILSENFRSSNEILNYAKTDFVNKTLDESHKIALANLKNNEIGVMDKPKIISVAREDLLQTICALIKQLNTTGEKIAVVARTNYQISALSKELTKREIEHSSTFFSASDEAKENIITFLQGVFSKDMQLIKNSLFTPFAPITLQDAFEVGKNRHLTIEEFYSICPAYKTLRNSVNTIEDINILFKDRIIPIALSYGEEYLLASLTMQNACMEALRVITDKTLIELVNYLKSYDLLVNDNNIERKIILTTVHKSKGKEYDNVIYVPSKPRDNVSFQDKVVEAILKSKGIDAKADLEEETLRVNFVAYTRAKKRLFILAEKPNEFLNEFIEKKEIENLVDESVLEEDLSELKRRAYNLFVNKEYEEAKKALENDESWLLNFVEKHFKELDRISFSRLTSDPYEYLLNNIILFSEYSQATNIGSEVHKIAEEILKDKQVEVREELRPYIENVKKIWDDLKKQGYELIETEHNIVIPLSEIIQTKNNIKFKGVIDGVLKKGDEILLIDWKTSKKTGDASKYRQQLETYRRLYSSDKHIPLEKIKVSICFIGLRKTINDGNIDFEYDSKQPIKTAFDTVTKQLNIFMEWKQNPRAFLDALMDSKVDDNLIRSLKEQWMKERVN
ncbi:MAG: UvrD-helicase domain-containing protein [Candidatus Woesearchaeota archaeon]